MLRHLLRHVLLPVTLVGVFVAGVAVTDGMVATEAVTVVGVAVLFKTRSGIVSDFVMKFLQSSVL